MIWYNIQHYKDTAGLDWLVNALRFDGNIVDISLDNVAPGKMAELRAALPAGVHVRQSVPCLWGAPSQVRCLHESLEYALSADSSWKYFINLSGTCIPLRPQWKIARSLNTLAAMGLFNFVAGFRTRGGIEYQPANDDNSTLTPVQPHRGKILVAANALAAFRGERPAINWPAARLGLFCDEVPSERAIYVRSGTKEEQLRRQTRWKGMSHHVGRQWYILNRDFCEWLMGEFVVRRSEVVEEFLTCFLPDKSYLATVIYGTDNPWKTKSAIANFRLGFGRPLRLATVPADQLMRSHGFFARKLRYRPNCPVRQFLSAELLAPNPR